MVELQKGSKAPLCTYEAFHAIVKPRGVKTEAASDASGGATYDVAWTKYGVDI